MAGSLGGEGKNMAKKLTIDTLKAVMERVPSVPAGRRRVHLLFTTTVQDNYFTREAWKPYAEKNLKGLMNVAKLVLHDGLFDLVELTHRMPWVCWTNCTQLLVVVPIEDLSAETPRGKRRKVSK